MSKKQSVQNVFQLSNGEPAERAKPSGKRAIPKEMSLDLITFNQNEMAALDAYFAGTDAEIAYLLGKHCGLRMNECYGLKWANVDLDRGMLLIDRQMQYRKGSIKLVPVKTRHAERKVCISCFMREYLADLLSKRNRVDESIHRVGEQNQVLIEDIDGKKLSPRDFVNCLPNGKVQTGSAMIFHSRILQREKKIMFEYRYLRHTYAARLAMLNTPEDVLSRQMGDSKRGVTYKYYTAVSEDGIDILRQNLELL